MMCTDNKNKVRKRFDRRKSIVIIFAIYCILFSFGVSITTYSLAAAESIFTVIEVDGKRYPVEKYGIGNVSKLPIIILTEEGLKITTAFGFTSKEKMIPWLKKNDFYYIYQELQEVHKKRSNLSPHESARLSKVQSQEKSGRTLYLWANCSDDPTSVEPEKNHFGPVDSLGRFDNEASAVRHEGAFHFIFDDVEMGGNLGCL